MVKDHLAKLFLRDLTKLETEISLYQDEAAIWKTAGDIPNSAGNLCLHLIGNLNTYIGAELGKTGYIRHRDLEFSKKHVARETLISMIDETRAVVGKTLRDITETSLDEIYPLVVLEKETTTDYLLIHLAMHLSYHLGQINYHRRMIG